MGDEREIEMRVAGATEAGGEARIRDVLAALDAAATVRVDLETGIVHAKTRCDTLDVTDALTRAGLDATAMTG